MILANDLCQPSVRCDHNTEGNNLGMPVCTFWPIYIRLSRCGTARGSSTGFSLVGPAKVKACKSFLFTEGTPKVENKEHFLSPLTQIANPNV